MLNGLLSPQGWTILCPIFKMSSMSSRWTGRLKCWELERGGWLPFFKSVIEAQHWKAVLFFLVCSSVDSISMETRLKVMLKGNNTFLEGKQQTSAFLSSFQSAPESQLWARTQAREAVGKEKVREGLMQPYHLRYHLSQQQQDHSQLCQSPFSSLGKAGEGRPSEGSGTRGRSVVWGRSGHPQLQQPGGLHIHSALEDLFW